MLTTLVILAMIAVAGFAWAQFSALNQQQRDVAPLRIRSDEHRPRRRR
ncbi:hypothetical protein [Marinobacterium zhoushanense]|nr:hypothetical protein [Marinobacterium zhoushanense]